MIRSKPPSDTYRDGWDRIFGEKRTSPDAIVHIPTASDARPDRPPSTRTHDE